MTAIAHSKAFATSTVGYSPLPVGFGFTVALVAGPKDSVLLRDVAPNYGAQVKTSEVALDCLPDLVSEVVR